MKNTKQLLICLVLVLSACKVAPSESPAEPTTAPETTPTVMQTSPKVTTTPTNKAQPDEPDERVEFEPGTSSIEYSSILPSGLSIKHYVLAAKEGQIMTLNFVSEDVPVSLSIASPSGLQLFTEGNQTSPTDGGYRAGYSFTLAETGDYLVTLVKAEHTPSTNYTVEITIQ